ncbi:hypothetical protein [Fibrobacter succinogenes]|uniref:Outer membrane protein beta-barrel domain-containing protein n=1 Tax=Fibrobacter succinogenes TaxID=833 RepID=A0A380RW12_FIBSU|nr:hypothetical protein [Fibrobacter succinogenes]PWJ37459.1 hypothetical protein IE02_0946 [Fibrobacter succinogenes subsp. elongatus]SUQ19706.1 hypothetical protein SAMN05661053_0946 [Fibrobacter succinogenes]
MKTKLLTSILMALTLAVSSHAELQGSQDYEPGQAEKSEWSALFGVSGGNSLIARDGTIFMNIRIGIALNPYISFGAYHSSIMSNVKNPKVRHSQMIDYHAFGVFAEPTVYRNGFFSISLPVSIGGGEVDFMDKDDEDGFKAEDGFFTADFSAQFNFRMTKLFEISIGGGYRLFAGIEENNLKNKDFRTPFGELRFTFKE